MIVHPLAFVVLSDVRMNSAETPYYGAVSTNDLACPRGSLNHLKTPIKLPPVATD